MRSQGVGMEQRRKNVIASESFLCWEAGDSLSHHDRYVSHSGGMMSEIGRYALSQRADDGRMKR